MRVFLKNIRYPFLIYTSMIVLGAYLTWNRTPHENEDLSEPVSPVVAGTSVESEMPREFFDSGDKENPVAEKPMDADIAPAERPVIAEPVPEKDPFFEILLPVETVLDDPSEIKPPVAQNGGAPAPDAPLPPPPVSIRTLSEKDPIIDHSTDSGKVEDAASTNVPDSMEWVPFVYFYRRSPGGRTLQPMYLFPTAPVEAAPSPEPKNNVAASVPATSGTLVPVLYGPMPVVSVVPMVRTPPMPVFSPQVVPNRRGNPKWVYPNGVVIKPKVYQPGQPLKNTFRAVTP